MCSAKLQHLGAPQFVAQFLKQSTFNSSAAAPWPLQLDQGAAEFYSHLNFSSKAPPPFILSESASAAVVGRLFAVNRDNQFLIRFFSVNEPGFKLRLFSLNYLIRFANHFPYCFHTSIIQIHKIASDVGSNVVPIWEG